MPITAPDPGDGCEAAGGPPPGPAKVLLVVAVALIDADNRVMIARRPPGKAMAGLGLSK